MSCLCVVCLPCCVLLLDSSRFVAIVRIRSSMLGSASSVRLLHGLFLLPSGFLGKMTATLYLITIIVMLVASFYRFAALPIICSSSLPNCHVKPLTHHVPSKPLIGYVTALLNPSYSVASCRWRLEAVPCWNIIYLLVGISLYCHIILMHLYTW